MSLRSYCACEVVEVGLHMSSQNNRQNVTVTVHQGLGRERHWVCLEQPFLQSNTYGRHGCIPIYFFVYFHTLHFIVSSSLDYNDKTIKWEEMVVERGFKNLA